MKKTFSKQLPNEISNFFIFIGIFLLAIIFGFVLNHFFEIENDTLALTVIIIFFFFYGIMCFALAMLLSNYLLKSKKRELFFMFDNHEFSRSFLDSFQKDDLYPIYSELDAEYKQRTSTYVEFSLNTLLSLFSVSSILLNTLSLNKIYFDGDIDLKLCYIILLGYIIVLVSVLTAILYFLKAREYKIIKQKLIEEITKQSTPTISNIPACSFVYTESPQISCYYQNNTPSL